MEGLLIGSEENDRFLLCQVGSRVGALALKDVRETMRPLPIEPLNGMPQFVLGVAIVRGMPVPVIDARRLLSPLPSVLAGSAARFVTLKLGERTGVLLVDAVLEVRSIAHLSLAQIPPLLRESEAELVSALGALDAELLLVLEAARLIPDSIWRAVERTGAVP
jgi:purine-binding chemotaxis protein CheW